METPRSKPYKREVSLSIADLRNSVKRLAMEEDASAITNDNVPKNVLPNLRINVNPEPPILTVFSSAEDGFESKYEILNEIGKGGFSVVYRCRDKVCNAMLCFAS